MVHKTTHVAVAAAVAFIACATWLLGGWSHGDAVAIIDDVGLAVLALAAAGFAALAARSARGRVRAAWVALTVGLCRPAIQHLP